MGEEGTGGGAGGSLLACILSFILSFTFFLSFLLLAFFLFFLPFFLFSLILFFLFFFFFFFISLLFSFFLFFFSFFLFFSFLLFFFLEKKMGENPEKVRKKFPRKCGPIQPRLIEAREKTSVRQTVWGLRIPSCREGAKQSLSCPQKIGSQNGDPCDTVAWFC